MSKIQFTAEVSPMFGNIDLDELDRDDVLELIEDTYDLPADCITEVAVK